MSVFSSARRLNVWLPSLSQASVPSQMKATPATFMWSLPDLRTHLLKGAHSNSSSFYQKNIPWQLLKYASWPKYTIPMWTSWGEYVLIFWKVSQYSVPHSLCLASYAWLTSRFNLKGKFSSVFSLSGLWLLKSRYELCSLMFCEGFADFILLKRSRALFVTLVSPKWSFVPLQLHISTVSSLPLQLNTFYCPSCFSWSQLYS